MAHMSDKTIRSRREDLEHVHDELIIIELLGLLCLEVCSQTALLVLCRPASHLYAHLGINKYTSVLSDLARAEMDKPKCRMLSRRSAKR